MRPLYREVAAASEAGYAAGRARRGPSASELDRFKPYRVWDTYRSAYQRGLADTAQLEQMSLPGIAPVTNGVAARPRTREHRGKGRPVASGRA